MPAVTLKCHTRFITNTEVRENELLTISDGAYSAEMELGFNKNSGKKGFKVPLYGTKIPNSAVLNHCILVKASKKMAKKYLDFMKEAGCDEDDLNALGAKIEVFETAGDDDAPGADDAVVPQKKKSLSQMNSTELQAIAQEKGVEGWDTMTKKELVKEINLKG